MFKKSPGWNLRGKDNEVRVLSRVCPHRAMDIMPPGFGYDGHGPAEPKPDEPGSGQTRLFLCPYHAWTFELDGTLRPARKCILPKVSNAMTSGCSHFGVKSWNGFIFINLDGQAAPLQERLCEMNQDFGEWHAGEMKLVFQREWECPFNWKVLVENFMESYHHLGAHSKTLQPDHAGARYLE